MIRQVKATKTISITIQFVILLSFVKQLDKPALVLVGCDLSIFSSSSHAPTPYLSASDLSTGWDCASYQPRVESRRCNVDTIDQKSTMRGQ